MSTELPVPPQDAPPILAVEVKSPMLAWWGVIPVILFSLSQLVFGWPAAGRGIGFVPGYLIGRILGGLTIATLFAWIVFRLSRRTQIAATITFTVALMISSASTIATHFAPPPTPPAVQVTPPAQVAKLSQEELEDFAGRYERAFASGDANAVFRLIDFETIIDTALAGLDGEDEFFVGVREGARPAFRRTFEQLVQGAGGDGFQFLRAHQVDGRPRVLFRLATADGGLNYHDVLVDRHDGRIVAVDMVFSASGELLSQTWRRVLLPGLMQINQRSSLRLSSTDRDMLDHYDTIARISELQQQQEFQQALGQFNSLPASLRELKPLRLMRVLISADVNDDEYLAAMEDYRNAFPGDPSLLLIEVDYFLLRKETEAALSTIDQLDAAVEGDPYLNLIRSRIMVDSKRWDEGRRLAEQFIKDFPQLQDGYWHLAYLGTLQPDHDLVLETLKRLDQVVELQWEELEQSPEYAGFVNSPHYQEWLDYLAEKRAGVPAQTP
jgi:hypothetical protein